MPPLSHSELAQDVERKDLVRATAATYDAMRKKSTLAHARAAYLVSLVSCGHFPTEGHALVAITRAAAAISADSRAAQVLDGARRNYLKAAADCKRAEDTAAYLQHIADKQPKQRSL